MLEDSSATELSTRARLLLKALVEHYIVDGQPVGSRTLAKTSGLNISPATIRNVMSDLGKMGLVEAPHTSAGRVPTEEGFRLFVDHLLEVEPLQHTSIERLKNELDRDRDADSLVKAASNMLSDLTQMAGIVSLPKRRQSTLRQIEFLSLPGKRVLAILVINDKEVQNRIIHTEREYSPSELQEAANYLNIHFFGEDLMSIRTRLVTELKEARQHVDRIMKTVVEVAEKALDTSVEEKAKAAHWETNLISFCEFEDAEALQQLFKVFNSKRDMLTLLDRCIRAEGVKIFIGQESGFQGLERFSVITAPYAVGGKVLGVLGVIGPRRMNYRQAIPVVDVTAKMLGEALNS